MDRYSITGMEDLDGSIAIKRGFKYLNEHIQYGGKNDGATVIIGDGIPLRLSITP